MVYAEECKRRIAFTINCCCLSQIVKGGTQNCANNIQQQLMIALKKWTHSDGYCNVDQWLLVILMMSWIYIFISKFLLGFQLFNGIFVNELPLADIILPRFYLLPIASRSFHFSLCLLHNEKTIWALENDFIALYQMTFIY